MTNRLPEEIGMYKVRNTLGEGGTATIYKAVHPETGDEVAIKIVRKLNEISLQSIRREIAALKRLKHPGIVTLLEHGVDNGKPWYAMDLVRGMTLREYCRRITESVTVIQAGFDSQATALRDNRPAGSSFKDFDERDTIPYQAVLAIFKRLCLTLAFLHGEGIVHRDLKPMNIIVKTGGYPVLLDLGVMTEFSGEVRRERLSVEHALMGTVFYMAPEHIRNVNVDARADIYSLGCILYEIMSDQRMFPYNSQKDILRAHLYEEPKNLMEILPDIPSELADLVHRMLAKNPRDRIGYADVVATELAYLGITESFPGKLPLARPYLYRPQLSGRDTIITSLMERLEMLKKGQGEALFISGLMGSGKTRIAVEIGQKFAEDEIQIITGSCTSSAQPPFNAFRCILQAVADRCFVHGPEKTSELLGNRARVLSDYETSLQELPGYVSSKLAQLSPEASQLRLFSYFLDTIKAMLLDGPLLLILDDIQWLDTLSLGFFEFLIKGRHLDDIPFLIIATFRIEEASVPLKTISEGRTIELESLGIKAISSIIRDMLAIPEAPQYFAQHIARYAEGNPYFIAEYLNAAIEEGLLWRDFQGEWHIGDGDYDSADPQYFESLPLPHVLQDLIRQRFESLPEPHQLVLKSMSVVGHQISFILLWEITSIEELELLDIGEELARRQFLKKSRTSFMMFSHDKIKDIIYQQIDEAEHLRLHYHAAQCIEDIFARERKKWLIDLAYHWEKAGEIERAKDYYIAAARNEKLRDNFHASEKLYRRFLDLNDSLSKEIVIVENEYGEVLHVIGRNQDARNHHENALQIAQKLGFKREIAVSQLNLANIYLILGNLDLAQAACENAIEIAIELGERELQGNLVSRLALVFHDKGEPDTAELLYEKALRLHREEGNRQDESRTLSNLAIIFYRQGKLDAAKNLFNLALTTLGSSGNKLDEGALLANLALIHFDQGRLAESQQLSEKALEIHRAIGDRLSEGLIISNLALIYQLLGDMERAMTLNEEALVMSREVSNRWGEGHILSNLALLYGRSGNIQKSMTLINKALEIFREIKDKNSEGNILSNLGFIKILAGEIEEAWELLNQSLEITEGQKSYSVKGTILNWMAMLTRRTTTDFALANDYNERALAIFGELDAALDEAIALCEYAFCQLAQGVIRKDILVRTRQVAADYSMKPTSELNSLIISLQKSFDAFEASEIEQLHHGEHKEYLPEGLKKWLMEKGMLIE